MTWVRLDDAATLHPKLLVLSDGAFRLWINGLALANRTATDGQNQQVTCAVPEPPRSVDAEAAFELRPRALRGPVDRPWRPLRNPRLRPSSGRSAQERESSAGRNTNGTRSGVNAGEPTGASVQCPGRCPRTRHRTDRGSTTGSLLSMLRSEPADPTNFSIPQCSNARGRERGRGDGQGRVPDPLVSGYGPACAAHRSGPGSSVCGTIQEAGT